MKPIIKSTSSGIMIKTDGEYFSMLDKELLFKFLDEFPEKQKELLELIHKSFVEKSKEFSEKLILTGQFDVHEFVPYVNNATQYSQIINTEYTLYIRKQING